MTLTAHGPTARQPDATGGMTIFGFRTTPTGLVLAVLIVGTLIRVAVAAVLGLGVDEAYTVANARSLQWSYFDHPPMSFWLVHATVWLTGSEANLVVRLPFIGLFALSGWLTYRLGSRLFSAEAGAWTVVLLNLAPVYTIAFGGWVLPDGPLMAAMLACVLALVHLLDEPTPSGPAGHRRRCALTLAVGLLLGLACLSKYHGFLLGGGILLFLLSSREHRHWFAMPHTWVAGVLALAVFSPVLIWNAENDWVSLAFQAGRAAALDRAKPQQAAVALLGQILYVGPWIWVPLVWAVARAMARGGRDAPARLLFLAGVLPVAIFTLVPLWGSRGLPHWAAPGYLFWLPFLGREAARWWQGGGRKVRWWLAGTAALVLVVVPVLASNVATGWAGRAFPALFAKGDPTREMLDWTGLRDRLDAGGDFDRQRLFVAVWHWIDAGKVDAALGGRLPVTVLSDDPRNFAFQHDLRAFIGWDAILVAKDGRGGDWIDGLRPYFAAIEPLPGVCVDRAGRCEIALRLYRARGYRGRFPLPYARSPENLKRN